MSCGGREAKGGLAMAKSKDSATTTTPEAAGVSRRALLGRAVGAAAAGAAAAVVLPASALAANGDPVLAGATTGATATTHVLLSGVTGFTGVALLANATGYGPGTSIYAAASGGWAGPDAAHGGNGVTNGVYGYTDSGSGNGVIGRNGVVDGAAGGAGVLGISVGAGAVGVRAVSNAGTALKVEGPAQFDGAATFVSGAVVVGRAVFTRSGRAGIPKGKTYVDVTVPGGLGSTANVLATLQVYRVGVYVAACRRDYPSADKVRIYLNKVASNSLTTAVAWFVFG
jgi:hypothetical protein